MIDTSKEYIACSAIWYDDQKKHVHQPKNIESGFVLFGLRHHNCITTASFIGSHLKKFEPEQGFLTSRDRFVTREEGARLAFDCGQIDKEIKELHSEDIFK